jgi:hypothetical protein
VKDPSPTERVRAWEETVTTQTYPGPLPTAIPYFWTSAFTGGDAGICLAGFQSIRWRLPETKGQTLEEIEESLAR